MFSRNKYTFPLLLLVINTVVFSQPAGNNANSKSTGSSVTANLTDVNDKDSFEEYMSYEGKFIKTINIIVLDVAGPSVEEGSVSDTSWLGNIGNTLHYNTRDWVVRNALLFTEGDTIDARSISESERLLRSSGFFLDARIKIVNDSTGTDSVNVEVVAKDRWTISVLASYDAKNKNSYFGFRDYNFLGLGHILDATLTHDEDNTIGWGGAVKYNAYNVEGTHVNIATNLETNERHNIQNINFTRPFLTTEFEWAGGIDLTREEGKLEYINSSQSFISLPYKLNSQDFWIGKSYTLWFGSNVFRQKSKIITSARVFRKNYDSRPAVDQNTNRMFEKYVLYLFNLGIINSRFYKDNYLASFGVTEDIQVGGYIAYTGGIEKRELSERWYSGIEAVYSRRLEGIGYVSGKFGLGGFRNVNKWEQNVININFLYHSPLIQNGKWKFRFVVNNDYLYGFNRFDGEQIYLDSPTTLRGFNRFALYGTKRVVLNSEALIFSPFAPLGFNIGGVAFVDLGLIARRDQLIVESKLYQGYGFGFRINNESIARANFQVALVYNPFSPYSNRGDVKIVFVGNIIISARLFGFDKPSLINFNDTR